MSNFSERASRALASLSFREGRQVTLAEVAKRLAGVTGGKPLAQATVSRWFSGKREPTLAQIEALAEILGEPPGQLAFDPPTRRHG